MTENLSFAQRFETKTGANFGVYDGLDKVAWLIDLGGPEEQPTINDDNALAICMEMEVEYYSYNIVYRNNKGIWKELGKTGNPLNSDPEDQIIRFIGFLPWHGDIPTEKQVSDWRESRNKREKMFLLTDNEAAELFACAMQLMHNIVLGKHSNSTRGTTELTAKILLPVAEILTDLNWQDVKVMKIARRRVKELCNSEPEIMHGYSALSAFGRE